MALAFAIDINMIHMLNVFKNISPVDNFGTSNYAQVLIRHKIKNTVKVWKEGVQILD